jgi:hypothetical protein
MMSKFDRLSKADCKRLAGPILHVTRLLDKLANLSPEQLRQVRSVEALEQMVTPKARQLLTELAKGAPDARLTRDAKAALQRLQR